LSIKNSHWTRHKGNWNKKTAIKNVIAIIAPAISCIAFLVAFNGDRCSSSILAWTASITTIASSTTTYNTKANNVIKLSEISKNCMKIKVPTNDTGTAIAGLL
jgi:hypothetical protein